MIQKILNRAHLLWETHEIHMEIAILGLSLMLIGVLVWPSAPTVERSTFGVSPQPTSSPSLEIVGTSAADTLATPPVKKTDDRARISQDITKTNRKIEELQKTSLELTSMIQKVCGGQTNDCAKSMQTTLEETARAYEVEQTRLRALTASLGNL